MTRHGSLFSGIGGFDLAAQWMGWKNVFQCEKDEWCRKVLAKNFPETKQYNNIEEFNAKLYNGAIDVISGGFPCQPFSIAGKRKGKDDDRYLWHEMLRVITEVQPPFVVGENVTGIISLALDTVLSDLEAQGYTTETYIIPACSKNAWHRRDRVWIIAHKNTDSIRRYAIIRQNQSNFRELWKPGTGDNERIHREAFLSDPTSTRLSKQGKFKQPISNKTAENEKTTRDFAGSKLDQWEVEPAVGRVADGIPNRVDRLKGLGNAIVPQIAHEIFIAIDQYFNSLHYKNSQ